MTHSRTLDNGVTATATAGGRLNHRTTGLTASIGSTSGMLCWQEHEAGAISCSLCRVAASPRNLYVHPRARHGGASSVEAPREAGAGVDERRLCLPTQAGRRWRTPGEMSLRPCREDGDAPTPR